MREQGAHLPYGGVVHNIPQEVNGGKKFQRGKTKRSVT